MTPTILPSMVEDLYRYQVWCQGPLFLVATLVLTGLLMLLARMKGQAGDFGWFRSLTRISRASRHINVGEDLHLLPFVGLPGL